MQTLRRWSGNQQPDIAGSDVMNGRPRVVKRGERKPETDAKVELGKIRRELLTLVARIEKLIQG